MRRYDQIKVHLMSKTLKMLYEKGQILDHDGFFFFDDPIIINKRKIDRVQKGAVYYKDQILPMKWSDMSGPFLKEVYTRVKANKIYAYLESEGRFYKTRVKNRV